MVGGAVAVVLLGGRRLASGIGGGCMLVGAALAGVATWQAVALALLLLVVLGVGYAPVEVAGLTLNQPLASDDVLGCVLGVIVSPTSSRPQSARRPAASPSGCSVLRARCS